MFEFCPYFFWIIGINHSSINPANEPYADSTSYNYPLIVLGQTTFGYNRNSYPTTYNWNSASLTFSYYSDKSYAQYNSANTKYMWLIIS